jgi:hypothetical protein
MSTEGSRNGIDRRRFLRRAAAVGAAAAWATPVVKTIAGTPAFAQGVAGSPIGGGDSSLSVCYTIAAPTGDTGASGDTGGGAGGGGDTQGLEEPVEAPEVSCLDPRGSGYFSVSGLDDGGDGVGGNGIQSTQLTQTIQVSLTPAGVAAGARIVSASADCGPGTVSSSGDSATITCAG